MLLSQRHPLFYFLSVREKQLRRRLRWEFSGPFARRRAPALPVRVRRHRSLLIKHLGDSDMWLQHNKVDNLSLAAPCIDGVVVRPGQTLSLWRLVGRPDARRGFKPGMVLRQGEVMPDVGGGLCQLGNLILWLGLHSPLTLTERHHHSFDPFPDSGRVLPFGSGCSLFYNYLDLQFRNDTPLSFQFLVRVGRRYLLGELRASGLPPFSYHVFERNHRFTIEEGRPFRSNELWRRVVSRRTGHTVREELLWANHSLVKYPLPDHVRSKADERRVTGSGAALTLSRQHG